jgi:hypothetical protein
LTEWIAYEKITGPLGRRRQDIQAALIATTIANANRGKGRKFKISDFLIQYDRLGQQKSPEQMIEALKSINAAMGGVEVNGRR